MSKPMPSFKRRWTRFAGRPEDSQDTLSSSETDRIPEEPLPIGIEDPVLRKQLAMIGLGAADLESLRRWKPVVEKNAARIVGEFYKAVLEVGSLQDIIHSHSTMDRLTATLVRHVAEIFDGRIDEGYVGKRSMIAKVHLRIGLEPKWYIAAFQRLQEAILDVLSEHPGAPREYAAASRAVAKVLNLEQQLVLEAYEKEYQQQKELQYQRVKHEVKTQILGVSTELAALTEQTSASVQELLASSQEVNLAVETSASKSESTMEMSMDGKRRIQDLEGVIAAIHRKLEGMEAALNKLSSSSASISRMTDLVREIANQTNILSLNASIEAARAGVHGRGFTVVAGEVKKLADETRESVRMIAACVTDSVRQTGEVIDGIIEIKGMMEEGTLMSAETRRAFETIVRSMALSIGEITGARTRMNELVAAIEEIGDASGKVAASAESLNDTASHF
ncbi:globin-coupled sensor protein [Cohnella sp. AR92]|uniref:globin-coupled sensor protein n=1 Tax=Cohnella sp. AR92 TaxID=648716 RepID=UPI000F8E13B2|nr:globin-coupled sensor protein [Cohnella sp. AR92]RUS48509.1 globin-coupled sensor protein [Cohnella sp. AR92]